MSTEHRRAPRREVVQIDRVGAWGQVKYQHKLSCGHIEVRPRAATTGSLACAWCLRAEEKNTEIKALSAPSVSFIPEEEQSITDFDTMVERLRAGIAAKFSVPLEAIDINVTYVDGNLQITSGIVFLSAADIARLGKS